MKAIAYARYTAADQLNQISIHNPQEEIIRSYCAENNIELLEVFYDIGSGLNFQRPGWESLIAFLTEHRNEINFLVVSSSDRISRNNFDAQDMVMSVEYQFNIAVIYPKEHLSIEELSGKEDLC